MPSKYMRLTSLSSGYMLLTALSEINPPSTYLNGKSPDATCPTTTDGRKLNSIFLSVDLNLPVFMSVKFLRANLLNNLYFHTSVEMYLPYYKETIYFLCFLFELQTIDVKNDYYPL